MITVTTDRFVDDYLRRLDHAATALSPQRRTELVAEIREHIEEAVLEEGATDEVAIRNVLERLGPPEEIVAAAAPPPSTATPGSESGRVGRLEIAALIALVFPIFGWLIGVVLVVVSRAWSSREKVVGLSLGLLPVLLPALALGAGAESGGGSGLGPAESLFVWVALFAGLPSAVYLGWRLRRSREAVS